MVTATGVPVLVLLLQRIGRRSMYQDGFVPMARFHGSMALFGHFGSSLNKPRDGKMGRGRTGSQRKAAKAAAQLLDLEPPGELFDDIDTRGLTLHHNAGTTVLCHVCCRRAPQFPQAEPWTSRRCLVCSEPVHVHRHKWEVRGPDDPQGIVWTSPENYSWVLCGIHAFSADGGRAPPPEQPARRRTRSLHSRRRRLALRRKHVA